MYIKRMIKKYAVLLAIWFVIYGLTWFYLVIKDLAHGTLNQKVFFFIQYNYNGHLYLMMIPLIPLLLSFNYLTDRQNSDYVRFKTRDNVLVSVLKESLVLCVLLSCLHEIINLISVRLLFADLLKNNLLYYCFINLVTVSIYYFRSTCIFCVLKCLFNRRSAALLIFCIYFFEVMILKPELFLFAWIPCDDISIFYNLISGDKSLYDVGIVIVRGLVMDIVVLISAILVNRKRDYLNEKA